MLQAYNNKDTLRTILIKVMSFFPVDNGCDKEIYTRIINARTRQQFQKSPLHEQQCYNNSFDVYK